MPDRYVPSIREAGPSKPQAPSGRAAFTVPSVKPKRPQSRRSAILEVARSTSRGVTVAGAIPIPCHPARTRIRHGTRNISREQDGG